MRNPLGVPAASSTFTPTRLLVLLALLTAVSGCSLFPWQSSRYGGETSEVYFMDLGKDEAREVTYKLRLGDNVADVFFAFVNYGDLPSQTLPVVTAISPEAMAAPASGTTSAATTPRQPGDPAGVTHGELAAPRRMEPESIMEFNNSPPALQPAGARGRGTVMPEMPSGTVVPRAGELVGDYRKFWQYDGDFLSSLAVETDTHLRKVVNDGQGNILNVWVADNEWLDAPNDSTGLITPGKVDALADAFLLAGADNDIHDWVTTMLGEPWGEHSYGNLLSPQWYGNTVDILLLDILLDNQTDSGVVGFFWGKDNYYTTNNGSATDKSNQRIMFYLDAPMYGQLDGGTWDPGDEWPELVVSTLAHEFQHMIHFYQKNILRGSGQDTQRWLNEMASMVTEDLVSYQMEVPGPRGVSPVSHSAGTAGEVDNTSGWPPYFNANNDIGLYSWDLSDSAPNYAINYGLGAFMARNYGGAQFLREVVQSPNIDEGAIQSALDALGYRVSYREVLSQWAAAVLTSNEVIVPWEGGGLDAVYNAGGWFESVVGSTTYRLGSINLFNYLIGDGASVLTGPRIYSSQPMGSETSRPAASVVYYEAGSQLTGTLEWQITLGAHTDLVVVAKASP